MLEELSMDKNILNRVAQPLSKGSSSDSRKSQDGKSYPRGSKRRESQGPSTSKFDQNRKPAPQKSKSLDKRPRSRGLNNGRKTSSEVADDLLGAEYGSVVIRESKKHNLNHLLNFHYAPRPGDQWGGFGNSSRYQQQQHYGYTKTRDLMATHKHKYNKEQFLQANCQFVVRSDGDYAVYLADPDALVSWELVQQIIMPTTGEVNCPICLFEPVAAKMTRCGHIYCWSCILHYLALSDKTWRKCPICYEAVHKGDLKSVVALPRSFCAVGEPISLKLMKREKGAMQCVPVSQFDAYNFGKPLSVSEGQLDTIYAKLLVADNNEVLNIVEQEEKQLLNQMKEDQGCPEVCFVEQALEAVKERKAALLEVLGRSDEIVISVEESKNEDNLLINDASDTAKKTQTVDYWNADTEAHVNENVKELATETEALDIPGSDEPDNRVRYESTSSEGGEEGAGSFKDSFTPEDLEFHPAPVTNNQPSKYYYFYQASDGQQVYLHAINTRMLEMNFGSLENCPHTITGRVLEKESGSMTEELRKRLRYLQHLPVTCQFEVVEIELNDLVSKEVIASFREQLEGRDRRRAKRAREERKRERKIEANEKKMYGQFVEPRRRIRLDSYQHFPECGLNEAFPLPARSEDGGGFSDTVTAMTTAVASTSLDDSGADPNSLSFAQMLRDGKGFAAAAAAKAPSAWPSINKQNQNRHRSCENFPSLGTSPPAKPSISEALHTFCQSAAQGTQDVDGGASAGKKKKKKQVLFSTGI